MQDIDTTLTEWAAAERDGDTAALDTLLTGDFTAVGPLGFILPKQAWLARHRPGILEAAGSLGMLSDWIVYRLSGTQVTEPSCGSSSGISRRRTSPCGSCSRAGKPFRSGAFARSAIGCGPPFRALLHVPQPGGVDQAHHGRQLPPLGDLLPVVVAQPQFVDGV